MFKKQLNQIVFVSILVLLCAVNVLSNEYAVDSNGNTVLVDKIAIERAQAGFNDFEDYYNKDKDEEGYEGDEEDEEDDYYEGDEEDDYYEGDEEDDYYEDNEEDDYCVGDEEDDHYEGDEKDDYCEDNEEDDYCVGDEEDDYYEGDEEDDYYVGDEEDDYYEDDEEEYDYLHMSSEEYEKIERDDEFDWRIHGSISDLWYNLGCSRIFENPRPIHSQSLWKHARAFYKTLALEDNCTLPDHEDNGFLVEFEVKQSPGKGRGIFATQDIKKGQLIHQLNQTARFDNGSAYRKFILGLEAGFACDVLQWGYVQDLNGCDADATSVNLKISVDLDEGCLFNDGWVKNDGYWENKANMGIQEIADEFPGGCSFKFFALRDIKAGEEILDSYCDFVLSEGWFEFGLQ